MIWTGAVELTVNRLRNVWSIIGNLSPPPLQWDAAFLEIENPDTAKGFSKRVRSFHSMIGRLSSPTSCVLKPPGNDFSEFNELD